MASKELIIDDEYCKQMGSYCVQKGEELDGMVNKYIEALTYARRHAIVGGDVAEALNIYIDYAACLKKEIGLISNDVNKQITDYLSRVDEADKYLF